MLHTSVWQKLKHSGRAIAALAPMEEVTDSVFRRVAAKASKPDVYFTEFTNVEGLASPFGRPKIIHRLHYTEKEKPIVAQLWGITPDHYKAGAQLAVDLHFDGLDINMGCPVKKVIQRGACSALIKNPTLAKEIVSAAREGLQSKIPISIKTRIGFSHIQTEEWIGFILREIQPDALTIHLRTVKELSIPEPHWEEMRKIIDIRNTYSPHTVVLANGNITNRNHIEQIAKQYNCDGGMIGRGIFHNPWAFENIAREHSIIEKMELLHFHLDLYQTTWGNRKPFAPLKRFFKIYIHSFDGANEIRERLMQSRSIEEAKDLVERFQREYMKQ